MEHDDADVIVVGAGLAGLVTALSVTGRRVTIVCPSLPPAATATALAQGGIAAAVGDGDDPAFHAQDTMRAGAGESCAQAVRVLCTEALPAIHWLEEQGVRFDRIDDNWALHREAAHACARVLHVGGDATGAALANDLYRAACSLPTIEFREGCTAVALNREAGRVAGIVAFDASTEPLSIDARDTVLATGGIGQLYCHTTNPRSACGDGLAMALAAGARCAGLEFVQFHPTALASTTADPLSLVTEALRGAGAVLVDEHGVRFMLNAHPAAELAPRDVVARKVWSQVQAGRRVYLDAARVFSADPTAFPSVRMLCAGHGIDPQRQPIPIVPAAHYHMGGVAVDIDGRSSIPHLWACGEVASTGVHGANRLASNSLLEAVVFGRRLGAALDETPRARRMRTACIAALDMEGATLEVDAFVWNALRRLMWDHLGIMRHDRGLRTGLKELEWLASEMPAEQVMVRGRLRVAAAMIGAALSRKDTRGAHVRTDSCRRRRIDRSSGWASA